MSVDCSHLFPGSASLLGLLHKQNDLMCDDGSCADTGSSRRILLEICGCMNLSIHSSSTIDPFCLVRVDQEAVHRTQVVQKDANPIFTCRTGSLTLLQIFEDTQEVSMDVCSGSRRLASCRLSPKTLLRGTSERVLVPLEPATKQEKVQSTTLQSTLALRYRIATMVDIEFMRNLAAKKEGTSTWSDKKPTYADIDVRHLPKQLLPFTRQQKQHRGKTFYRVKPYPDPQRPHDTTWLSRDDLETTCRQPSTKWIRVGNGTLGHIWLEILEARNLPNLDVGVNDKTDPFALLAVEDVVVRTDVILDALHPQWMPWTHRAFCIQARHPTSLIKIGVFDYDADLLNDHDPVGRCVIDLSHLHPHTVHILHLNLHHGVNHDRGTLVVRLKWDWYDPAEATRLAYTAPARFIVNFDTPKAYRLFKYVNRGALDLEQPSLDSVKLYVNELLDNYDRLCYLLDVLLEVWLWRGRLQVTRRVSIWFPIQSAVLFGVALAAIERPDLLVSIVLYYVAFLLMTTSFHSSRDPNPWKRSLSSWELNFLVLFGWKLRSSVWIQQNDGKDETELLQKLNEAKSVRMKKLIAELAAFCSAAASIYSKSGSASLDMEKGVWKLQLTKLLDDKFKYPHMALRLLCGLMQGARDFVWWRQPYRTHRIVQDATILATFWLIFPFNWILHWVIRLAVLIPLGPWVGLWVDRYCFTSWYLTREQLIANLYAGKPIEHSIPDFEAFLQSPTFLKLQQQGRAIAEEAVALRDMRIHLYGEYSEVVRSSRDYHWTPRGESIAFPDSDGPDDFFDHSTTEHHPGQLVHLVSTPQPHPPNVP